MKVSVIGTGYVGLVSGVCLAEKGHKVVCVDVDQDKVDQNNKGVPTVHEKGLEELLKKNLRANFSASTNLARTVYETDMTLIAVGTPYDGREIDLAYIKTASAQIGRALRDKDSYHVVVVKSTVVPGTTDNFVGPILESASGKRAGIDFGLVMNPEFLREGEAILDFMNPDRIVMGGVDSRSIAALDQLYEVFPGADKIRTSNKVAEMIKYASNSLLATLISFSNEIGNLCAAVGDVDVVDVLNGVCLDKRLCPITASGERIVPPITTYLQAGCGFGGSCFPKDVKALIAYGNTVGRPMQMLKSVIELNEQQHNEILLLLRKHYPDFRGLHVAVLGLAFKPGTDDIRESPAIPIINKLLGEGAIIKAFDPVACDAARNIWAESEEIAYCQELSVALEGVEAILLLTRWEEFQKLPELLGRLKNTPLLIDGRRMLDKSRFTRYEGIGL